ncbi:EAL domain-containing protein [Pelagibacterium sp.]|uniref:EAL domain-containing protein n=1 Tax=Pelagibacterium sp. TaxID=1967288 RepID=UPI003A9188AF
MIRTQNQTSQRERLYRVAGAVIIALGLIALAAFNATASLDSDIADWRFGQSARTASQDIVFLDIDGATLDAVGVWPWPRAVYAQFVDRVLELGAYDIWVDIDFSATGDDANDDALAAALEAAGGYAYLAAFQRSEDGKPVLTHPRFLEYSDMFSVSALTDASGVVRAVPSHAQDQEHTIPSLATALAGSSQSFFYQTLDYGIDANSIPRVSAKDLLDGSIAPEQISGKHVVMGASALELKDLFFTPNQGPLPGAVIQILAAETSIAGRGLVNVSQWWMIGAAIVLIVLQIALPIQGPIVRIGTIVVSALAVEGLGLALYLESAVMLPTGIYHVGAAALIIGTVVLDTSILGFLVQRLGGERDAFRAMLKQVITDNYDGVLIAQPNGEIISASRFATEFLARDLAGQNLLRVLPLEIGNAIRQALNGGASVQGEAIVETDSLLRTIEYVVTHSTFGERKQSIVTVTFRDITGRKRNEAKLRYLARHDPTTDTLSRAGFVECLYDIMAGESQASGVFVVQLERFGTITASLGHGLGDALLRQFADRLHACGFSAVAHLGQGQFAVAALSDGTITNQFEKIADTTRVSFNLEGHMAAVGLSAGYAEADRAEIPETWLSRAETALVSNEKRNLNRLAIYDGSQSARVSRNRTLEAKLATALEGGQFLLQYQPQIDLRTGTTIGAEALLRWRRDDEIVPPGEFLPIAEETGMIVDITRWILVEACRTAALWTNGMRVAVNISAMHFELGDLVADVKAALDVAELPASRLELEITETATMSTRVDVIEQLEALRSMGITIAIDDFGTGQSSLAYLDRLPFDILKIDKSFVDRLAVPGARPGIVTGIIGIAHTMGKRVLAEGIEHATQAEVLKNLGCEYGQGYYWSPPTDGAVISQAAA